MFFTQNGLTRKQWLMLHFGVLLLAMVGFAVLTAVVHAERTAFVWLGAGMLLFINLPSPRVIRTESGPRGWRGRDPWFAVGDRVRPKRPLTGYGQVRPLCTITAITPNGFEFAHELIPLGSTSFARVCGGETYDPTVFDLEND